MELITTIFGSVFYASSFSHLWRPCCCSMACTSPGMPIRARRRSASSVACAPWRLVEWRWRGSIDSEAAHVERIPPLSAIPPWFAPVYKI